MVMIYQRRRRRGTVGWRKGKKKAEMERERGKESEKRKKSKINTDEGMSKRLLTHPWWEHKLV